jgi:peptidoglycan hydrolase-like protein with peptidoglycan-binding domain
MAQITVEVRTLDLRNAEKTAVTGKQVKQCQALLNAGGASPVLAIDGIAGPKTKKEVLDFQAAKNLDKDAIVGPKTWTALIEG